jgi:hypothetical protein
MDFGIANTAKSKSVLIKYDGVAMAIAIISTAKGSTKKLGSTN